MRKNPFTTPLPSTARSSEYGFVGDHFDLPTAVDVMDEVAYPEFTGVNDGPAAYRSNTGETFQTGNPEYAGTYELGFQNAPGIQPSYSEAGSPGSLSLVAPRDSGSTTGTNRQITSAGPVDGRLADQWSGHRAELNRPNPNYGGPVNGGADYASGVHNAYFASQAQALSQEAMNAAMVSAV